MKDLFDLGVRKRRFGVVGYPVEHSKSPQIHRLFAQQCGLELEYTAIQLDRGGSFKVSITCKQAVCVAST